MRSPVLPKAVRADSRTHRFTPRRGKAPRVFAARRYELIKLLTAAAWVVTIATLPMMFLGVLVLPIAITLTVIMRSNEEHDAEAVGWMVPLFRYLLPSRLRNRRRPIV
jgi:hypothetical protein